MTGHLPAKEVHMQLRRFMLADGYELVLDLKGSHGSWLRDGVTGDDFLDFFTCFASWPIGYNHPVQHTAEFREEILDAAMHNPANADLYTVPMAEFVKEFGEHAMPAPFRHVFFISGGTLGVENALKAAFDWKVQLNRVRGITVREADGSVREEVGHMVLHFKEAFHGRSGYTLSMTNTADPRKHALFPKFPWPRVSNPKMRFPMEGANLAATLADEEIALKEIEAAFTKHKYDIAAILIEPIQCEGGDNHFRPEFLRKLREIADREDAMLIFDEVQTGFYGSGKTWCYQWLGVEPDLVAFGKKTQVCGFMSGPRIEKVDRNVFVEKSRINSTWGANLTDMVRAKWIQRAILKDRMTENAAARGEQLGARLRELGSKLTGGWVTNVRARGTLVAFDCPTAESRDELRKHLYRNRMLALACGVQSIRFRPPLNLTEAEADEAMARLTKSLREMGVASGATVPVAR